jgi:hypothetical protein
MNTPNSLNDIDDDVLNEIYKLLNLEDRLSILKTSQSLRDVVKDEKYEPNIAIDFGDATDIQSHTLPRFGKEYEIYPNVFIFLTSGDGVFHKHVNVKIKVKNYKNVSCISKGVVNNNRKEVRYEYFIDRDMIQMGGYKLYTFKLGKNSYILGINNIKNNLFDVYRSRMFIWACPTERIENKSLKDPYIYKYVDLNLNPIKFVDFKNFELITNKCHSYCRHKYQIDIDNMNIR